MVEIASLLAAYLAFALLHAARPERVPFRVAPRLRRRRAWRIAARALAAASFSLSVWLWRRTEAGPAAFLVPFAAFLCAASLFVLLAPVWPRAAWGLALLCPPAVAALSFAGAFHG
ncbi:hypothetical protein WMF37_48685 [Sorangium sp. So ce291]|uniref:hypothetical protein n=1 Tax=Sorangium sp. So ce291 TaxID=3133294 RepID=UPI003F5EAAE9